MDGLMIVSSRIGSSECPTTTHFPSAYWPGMSTTATSAMYRQCHEEGAQGQRNLSPWPSFLVVPPTSCWCLMSEMNPSKRRWRSSMMTGSKWVRRLTQVQEMSGHHKKNDWCSMMVEGWTELPVKWYSTACLLWADTRLRRGLGDLHEARAPSRRCWGGSPQDLGCSEEGDYWCSWRGGWRKWSGGVRLKKRWDEVGNLPIHTFSIYQCSH